MPMLKVMIAHSLGCVLTSSAIHDHGLVHGQYFMLDAASAMESYDASEYAVDMVESSWRNVAEENRASRWHQLFNRSGYESDFRRTLTWKGRFAGIANVVNCYSTSEDVVGNCNTNVSLISQTVWTMQELVKGGSLVHGINSTMIFDVDCEGGWGVNTYYALNPLWYSPGGGFTSRASTDLAWPTAVEHPLFTPFKIEAEGMHNPTNVFTGAGEAHGLLPHTPRGG